MAKNQEPKFRRGVQSTLEIAVSLLSGVLILGVIASLLWEATHGGQPPVFEARVGDVREVQGLVYVEIDVTNTGDESARGVEVRVTVASGENKEVVAEATIDWLPAQSTRTAVAVLERGLLVEQAEVRVVGYDTP